MGEGNVHEPRPPVSRRQVIRRGMVAGGVALWSAPVVAAAAFSRNDARDLAQAALSKAGVGTPTAAAAPGPVVAQQQTSGCTSYPPGTCITFECGGSHQSCGQGAGGFDCFCDVDATAACVCRNDAHCSDLATCNPGNGNGDCAAGYFCIPTSCCGIPKCAPPCGVLPPGARPASPLNQFLPLLNSILPPGTLSGI
jgi:hypothetical protein